MSLVVSRQILIVSQYFIYKHICYFLGFFLYSDYISSELLLFKVFPLNIDILTRI